MDAAYFVQAYRARGSQLVGQPTERFGYVDEALAVAARLSPWRAGIVVFRQNLDAAGLQRGRPTVLAIHGQVPAGWSEAERIAA
jgi:hypothetical protein